MSDKNIHIFPAAWNQVRPAPVIRLVVQRAKRSKISVCTLHHWVQNKNLKLNACLSHLLCGRTMITSNPWSDIITTTYSTIVLCSPKGEETIYQIMISSARAQVVRLIKESGPWSPYCSQSAPFPLSTRDTRLLQWRISLERTLWHWKRQRKPILLSICWRTF